MRVINSEQEYRGMRLLDRIEETIGYRLVSKIAEGGMGVVYRAEQEGFGGFRKTVAIKIISERYSKIPEFHSNFVGEAKLVSDLIHTNIVQTYHLGFAAGRCFMVMEYVNGYTLEEFLTQHLYKGKPAPADLAVFIVSRICRGLAYAHTKRDADGELLGENPFDCEDGEESRRRICEMPTPRLSDWREDVDEALAGIVRRSLERDRERRYQSAAEMLTALELYLYSDGYGPTNEKLAVYLRELFAEGTALGASASKRGRQTAAPGTMRT